MAYKLIQINELVVLEWFDKYNSYIFGNQSIKN